MEAWFEEDVEVFVHPRSPEVRVDVLPSSKHVRVLIDGQVVADSVRASVLYEASLPPRYYLPHPDVRMDLLHATATESHCPYKGVAHYWSATVDGVLHDDVAWGYRAPLPESIGVAGRVCSSMSTSTSRSTASRVRDLSPSSPDPGANSAVPAVSMPRKTADAVGRRSIFD